VEPAPSPGKVTNGVLLARPATGPATRQGAHWIAAGDEQLSHVPDDVANLVPVQFTPDGSEAMYVDRTGRVVALDVATGEVRTLDACAEKSCLVSVSPDATRVASMENYGYVITWLDGSRPQRTIEVPQAHGVPVWAPDGTRLAYTGDQGIYVADLSTGETTQVHVATDPETLFLLVSWSPDSSSLAFFDTEREKRSTRFTAMTVSLLDGSERTLLDAGRCVCLSGTPPALAWSPDGSVIAIASIQGAEAPGISFVTPDGERTGSFGYAVYAALAWQPLTG
jgi:Tol biopolymer transport system component